MKQRDIKFRCWDSLYECWDYYSLDDLIAGNSIKTKYEIKNEYTGLKDKQGKEIYEGDIVRGYEVDLQVIVWGSGKWDMKSITNGKLGESVSGFIDEYEIIGNIYENPELLKE